MNCESGVLSVMTTPFVPVCLIDTMFVPSRYRPMMSMRLVLLAGSQAVDDIGCGERRSVRPLDVRLDLQRQHLVAAAPLPALRQPGVDVTSTGDGRHDERLVHGALHEAAVQHRAGIRVEAARERRITRAGHDETRMCPGRRPACFTGRADAPGARIAATTATAPTTHAVTRPERVARAGLLILLPPLVALQRRPVAVDIHRSRTGARDPAVGRFPFRGTHSEPDAGNVYQIVSLRSRPDYGYSMPFIGALGKPNDVFSVLCL